MMRLKQLLGVFFPLLLITMAAAAVSQLTNVGVATHGNTTTVTLQASGAFTHNEYRPSDNLLLVDLAGVSPGKLQDQERSLAAPGVKSYRVLAYKGATGTEVTRIELNLESGAQLQVADTKGGVRIQVKGTATDSSAAVSPKAQDPVAEKPRTERSAAVKTTTPVVAKTAPVTKPTQVSESQSVAPIQISHVGVVRGKSGMEIEITGPSAAKSMTLTGPDRIVIDVPNAIPSVHTRNIMVNTPAVKSIRLARYQSDPLVTRIVVDLTSAHEYELVQGSGKLTVRLGNAVAAAGAPVPETPAVASNTPAPVMVASAKPEATPVPVVEKSTPKKTVEPVVKAAVTTPPVVFASAQPEKPPAMAAAVPPAPAVEKQVPAKPNDFVFVEPNYKEKPAATAEAKTIEPAERAAQAASTLATAKPAETPVPPAANAAMRMPAVNMALEQQQATLAAANAPQNNQPRYTGEPISVNLKDVDLKDFFRLIHEISGLNIVLDPNVKGSLTLVLDDVPWDQALEIVLANNGLDRTLQGNVLRIASITTLRAEADARRAQAEAEALAVDKQTITRFLSYAHAKDVMPTVKRFLSARGDVIADERTNALIIQDIPAVIPAVDRLLSQLDRKTQEVEIEARVVAATRNFARDIGTQLGFGWGNGPTAVGGAGAVGTSPLTQGYITPPPYFTTPGVAAQLDPTKAPTVTPAGIPLFSNLGVPSATSGLSLSTLAGAYRLDAILTMAESRGLLKVLSRPRVVTQNNIAANVRQGLRIPVVTQAQLGGPPTVTYVDAFLRLTVTPQITAEGTIFLAVDVENTNADFGRTVSGNPTLITQQATTQVLVTDGGTVVIGGVIQTQNSVNTSQVPLLGDIPVLGNLFKRHTVSTSTTELIFFLSPKIIQT
jgi:type IV pilus assembly protein PilQ